MALIGSDHHSLRWSVCFRSEPPVCDLRCSSVPLWSRLGRTLEPWGHGSSKLFGFV